ncbi:MotA/TolQ/ExbB proton channel family protein [Pseudoalteromonas sp. MMG013]|uniref:Biopolymer transport protein ExbB n=1 Tax=Pseudoalteromonas aurantia 208 TaxID=1314867 RepID=A0ABR9EHW6_9GAMM|nr:MULTISPECIES: MotA/TolQ/ExbB proton channel family protein [Pseudoalteromonas]MBE0370585.1 biopolymer transport protein ExbB [Pseudoalteromonas aurantia 208]MBQ4851861.1 MotA/TolQ/ExbB proton channel family protein [Pseudoalteromonas sp. MMG012]MBQ4860549.1 MotA/TolQ/ExbB proton channel family protein [Pseudoalteromonas sp. MMG013]
MNEIITQLGMMQWPFLVLSSVALTLILERGWVLIEGVWRLASIKTSLREIQATPERLQLHIQKQVARWRKRLSLISLIGMLSPLMGLFGTVWGLVVMFKGIADTQQAVTPALLADGLWGAMYSTVVGLAIAMPCIVFNGVCQALVEHMQTELTLFANEQIVTTQAQHA